MMRKNLSSLVLRKVEACTVTQTQRLTLTSGQSRPSHHRPALTVQLSNMHVEKRGGKSPDVPIVRPFCINVQQLQSGIFIVM